MESLDDEFMIKARYQKKINAKVSQCLTCERKCKIASDSTGHCQTRFNLDGTIYSIVYGCIAAISNNPIEKKPLYHFHPGSKALTIGTYGCNFDCFWCQNHEISHPNKNIVKLVNKCEFKTPDQFIEQALERECQGISISFNEPTLLFEYSLEVFKRARKAGLYNTYVSNGYMTERVLNDLVEAGLDAINIDIKGDGDMVRKYCGADIEKVWRNARLAKEKGIHVEITLLLIENFNSDEEIIKKICKRSVDNLGNNTPFHISRFFPQYKSKEYGVEKPTSLKNLKSAFNIAKTTRLHYVYLGNVMNSSYSHTYCPKCSALAIKRNPYFGVDEVNLTKSGNCLKCGHPICIK